MDKSKETVVHGEASESDEDLDTEKPMVESAGSQKSVSSMSKGIVVAGEASESDEEEEEAKEEVATTTSTQSDIIPLQVDSQKRGDSVDLTESEPKSPVHGKSENKPKYDTLLHKKLREKNASFRRNLCDTVGQIYISGGKQLKQVTQQLVKTQASVQDVSQTMRLLTNDLFHLEDKIDIVASCSLLPDINIDYPYVGDKNGTSAAVAQS